MTTVESLRTFGGVVLTNNISDNMKNGEFNFHSFHVGFLGYDTSRDDNTWGGIYSIFSKGLNGGERFDMAYESILGLSLIKTNYDLKTLHKSYNGNWHWAPHNYSTHLYTSEIGNFASRFLNVWNQIELIKDNHTLYQHWYGNHYQDDPDNANYGTANY